MKTYLELKQIGIISSYVYEDRLHIIAKHGVCWVYNKDLKSFEYVGCL